MLLLKFLYQKLFGRNQSSEQKPDLISDSDDQSNEADGASFAEQLFRFLEPRFNIILMAVLGLWFGTVLIFAGLVLVLVLFDAPFLKNETIFNQLRGVETTSGAIN
ncbi:hypothetical protein [Cochlodiniinecator piscidefendens]|uniref:hypothetical protein n=1 Tax=Cochlodiniinecator piscidefendens TaxID=2715756 RepID=UPI0014089C3C|nr:hypothetical protein [Cochlodiniinecator piscidefendens]